MEKERDPNQMPSERTCLVGCCDPGTGSDTGHTQAMHQAQNLAQSNCRQPSKTCQGAQNRAHWGKHQGNSTACINQTHVAKTSRVC